MMLHCAVVLACFALLPSAARSQPEAARSPAAAVDGWRADLDLIDERLPALHPNWFAVRSREQWEVEVGELREALPRLARHQRITAFMRLIAGSADGHTQFDWSRAGVRACPLSLRWLADGLLVEAAPAAGRDLVGKRVVGLAGTELDDVIAALRPIVPCDNEPGFRVQAPRLLACPAILAGIGIGEDLDALEVEVATDDGEHVRRRLEVMGDQQPEWVVVERPIPLCAERPRESFWWRHLPEQRLLYFKYNKCDQPLVFVGAVNQMFAAIRDEEIDRFVVDLRDNGGGSSRQFDALLNRLASSKALNRRGVLFGIIGQRTFSSALLNATDLRNRTAAILVGEPTGGRPNHFGEVRFLELPGTGTGVWHSTKRFNRVPGDPESLLPDLEVDTAIAQYLAGEDPVLAAVLSWRDDRD